MCCGLWRRRGRRRASFKIAVTTQRATIESPFALLRIHNLRSKEDTIIVTLTTATRVRMILTWPRQFHCVSNLDSFAPSTARRRIRAKRDLTWLTRPSNYGSSAELLKKKCAGTAKAMPITRSPRMNFYRCWKPNRGRSKSRWNLAVQLSAPRSSAPGPRINPAGHHRPSSQRNCRSHYHNDSRHSDRGCHRYGLGVENNFGNQYWQSGHRAQSWTTIICRNSIYRCDGRSPWSDFVRVWVRWCGVNSKVKTRP